MYENRILYEWCNGKMVALPRRLFLWEWRWWIVNFWICRRKDEIKIVLLISKVVDGNKNWYNKNWEDIDYIITLKKKSSTNPKIIKRPPKRNNETLQRIKLVLSGVDYNPVSYTHLVAL